MKKLIYAYGVYWLCVKTHEFLSDGTFDRILGIVGEKCDEILYGPEVQEAKKKLGKPESIRKVKNKIGF